jgi:3(or 17)beta-hydroxysteroid dehydrogenase
MKRLDKAVAMVTGGAGGLGRAIAERLAVDGARVVITDLQQGLGAQTANEGGFTFVEHDVCDETQWHQVIEEIERKFGRLTILVNNAGILGSREAASPENTELASWRKIFSINVEGVFLGCRAAIPAMRRAGGGSIVNLSSIADRMATPHFTAYGASKAAVRQLTMSVAQYCAEQKLNIRCNSVHPGMIRTPMLDASMEEMAQRRGISFDQVVSEHRSGVPLGDFSLPEDVAAAVAFLASDDARHMTGSALLVDGGIVHCNTYQGTSTIGQTKRR